MKYCSIDIETCGLIPEENSIIEFGAVLDDLKNQKPLNQLPTFHCYFIHDRYIGQPGALAMHPVIFDRINRREDGYDYISPQKLGYPFKTWLIKNGYESEKDRVTINVAGKNFGPFDYQFLRHQTDFCKHVKIRHKMLDPAILFLREDDEVLPGTEECKRRMGLDEFVAHNALDDAFDVVSMLRYKFSELGIFR